MPHTLVVVYANVYATFASVYANVDDPRQLRELLGGGVALLLPERRRGDLSAKEDRAKGCGTGRELGPVVPHLAGGLPALRARHRQLSGPFSGLFAFEASATGRQGSSPASSPLLLSPQGGTEWPPLRRNPSPTSRTWHRPSPEATKT